MRQHPTGQVTAGAARTTQVYINTARQKGKDYGIKKN